MMIQPPGFTAHSYAHVRLCRYTRIVRCSGHSSYVRHLDWSADSSMIQSACGAYELLYHEAATGKQVSWGKS